MSRKQPTNRIEVDLKLLQDKNAEKLLNFGRQFATSVENLEKALVDYASQLTGMANQSGSGQSKAASDARGVDLPTARTAGQDQPRPRGQAIGEVDQDNDQGNGFIGGVNYSGGGASTAPLAGDDSMEQQFVKAQKRIGEVPVGIRQTLGFAAEGQLDLGALNPFRYRKPLGELEGEDSRKQTPGMMLARRASDAMFAGAAVKANIRNFQRGMQGHYGFQNTMTNMGMDVGRSRDGGVFGWGSEAWREGAKGKLKNMKTSWLGLNPNYSGEQAAKTREIVSSYGYSGDQADFMADSLKQYEIHQGLNPDFVAKMKDPVMRYGMSDLSQLDSVLKNIPGAAKAARMNLQEFTSELYSVAEGIAQTTGMSQVTAAGSVAAASSVTGMSPSKVGKMLESKSQTYMSMAMTGQSFAKATIGPTALGSRFKAPMLIGNRVVQSYGFKSMGDLKEAYLRMSQGKKVDPKAEAAISALGMMQQANPDLFGDMNLKDLIVQGGDNVAAKVEARSEIEQNEGASYKRQRELAAKFGGENMREDFEEHQADFAAKMDETLSPAERAAKLSEEGQKHLIGQMNKQSRKEGESESSTIGLSDEAARWFRILEKDNGGEKSNSNRRSIERLSRKARADAGLSR